MDLPRAIDPVTIRPAGPADLAACAEIQHVALDGYLAPFGQQLVGWQPESMIRLFEHLLVTDPARFVVAERGGAPVGFASAWVRGGLWFLAFLFILPTEQGRGLGRRLLDAVLPRPDERAPDGERLVLAVATDSLQPISNALYAHYGMVPRMPVFLMKGRVRKPEAFPPLPPDVAVTPFASIDDATARPPGDHLLADVTSALDRAVLGFVRPADHRFLGADRNGYLVTDEDGEPLGYGYVRDDGRIGPVAAMSPALLPAIIGLLVRSTSPRGDVFSLLVPGAAGEAFSTCLAAGLRLTEAPTLLAWNRPFADFSRYVPTNNAIP